VAFQNASSILLARQRADEELFRTKEALRESQERLTAALTAADAGCLCRRGERGRAGGCRGLGPRSAGC